MDDIDHFLANLHFIGDGDFLFAVPLGTPEEVRARMFAAWKSCGSGLHSMDEMLSRHRDSWHFDQEDRTEMQVFVDDIVLDAREQVYAALSRWSGSKHEFNSMGQYAAGAALMRLHSSYTTLALLTRYGFGFEAASISRLVLEQIAWAYAIHSYDDQSLLEVSPTRSITTLKSIVSWAGRLYGTLSDYTHIDPKLGHEYTKSEGGIDIVLLRRPKFWSPRLAWVYALLVDAYVIITEVVFPNDSPIAARKANSSVELLPGRATRELIRKADAYALFDQESTS